MKKGVIIIILVVVLVVVFISSLFWQDIFAKLTGKVVQNSTAEKYNLICSKEYYAFTWHRDACDPKACGDNKFIRCLEGGVVYKYFKEICEKSYSTGCMRYATCGTWKEVSREKC